MGVHSVYIKDNLVVDNVIKFSNGKCEVLTLTIHKWSLSLFVVLQTTQKPILINSRKQSTSVGASSMIFLMTNYWL